MDGEFNQIIYIKLVKKKYVEFILILSINRWQFNNCASLLFLNMWISPTGINTGTYLSIYLYVFTQQTRFSKSSDTSCLSWQCWLRLTQNKDNTSSYWTYNSLRHPPSFVQPTCPDSLGQRSARTVTQQLWYNYWFRNCNPLNYSILAKLIILQWHVSAVEKWFQSVSLVKIIHLG